jgi:hypothetical protein
MLRFQASLGEQRRDQPGRTAAVCRGVSRVSAPLAPGLPVHVAGMAMDHGSLVSAVTETAVEGHESLTERLRQLTAEVRELQRGIDRLIGYELEPSREEPFSSVIAPFDRPPAG